MIGSTDLFGMYLPWLMPLAGVALLLMWLVRRMLAAFGLYRWIWHPAMFDMALYVLVLYGLSCASTLLAPTPIKMI